MQTKDDLIRENAILRARLDLAERWMQREVQAAMQSIEKQWVKSQVRRHFANLLEEEWVDIIARRLHETFGSSLEGAPAFTLERLIDAEIYWQTLQKYPTMDGLPIILAYQKILDAWVEKVLIAPWRQVPHKPSLYTNDGLTRDIENIIAKKYTLSLGRLYQILEFVREGKHVSSTVSELVDFWKVKFPEILATLVSDDFFLPFSELMNREIFTKKRHENKVTFSDVKIAKISINKLLLQIFS